MRVTVLLLALLLAVAGCRKAGSKKGGGAKIDACTLLTGAEIESVQGSPVIETKSSEHADAGLRNSQCYFAAKESSKSVSLVVAQADPDHPNARTVKEYWKETFGPDAKKEKEREEQESESAESTKIDGVGDDAYWVGVRVGGALYALKNQVFVRVSVGGPDDQKAKIEKSKKLAKNALDRL